MDSLELTLNVPRTYMPRTLSNFFNQLSEIKDIPERLSVLKKFMHELEQETGRMVALPHQAPVCMLLLKDAIKTLKEEEEILKITLLKSGFQQPVINAFRRGPLIMNRSLDFTPQHSESLVLNDSVVMGKCISIGTQKHCSKRRERENVVAMREEPITMGKCMKFDTEQYTLKEFLPLPPPNMNSEFHQVPEGKNFMCSSSAQALRADKGKNPVQITVASNLEASPPGCKISDGEGAFKLYKGAPAAIGVGSIAKDKGKQAVEGPSQPHTPPAPAIEIREFQWSPNKYF